jgi:hypothetical protein
MKKRKFKKQKDGNLTLQKFYQIPNMLLKKRRKCRKNKKGFKKNNKR